MRSKSKRISRCLSILIAVIFINNTDYFIKVGISIRPYYLVLVYLLLILGGVSRKINKNNILNIFCFLLLIITGLFGLLFCPERIILDENINTILLFVLQFVCFFVTLNAFYRCDKMFFIKDLLGILPILTLIPLLLYVYNVGSITGVANSLVPGIYTGHDGMPRLIGLFQGPNYFSLYMISVLSIIVYLVIENNIVLNKFNVIFIGIGLIDVLLTFSRSAFMVIVIYLMLFFIVKRDFRTLSLMIFVLLSIFIVAYSLDNNVLESMIERMENTGHDGSSEERLLLLKEGLLAPFSFPFGVGIGHCRDYYALTYLPKLAHNDFLTVLIECGILGLMSFLFIWYNVYRSLSVIGKITIISIAIMTCTLSCYGYESIIPILFSFFLVFNRYEKNINNK